MNIVEQLIRDEDVVLHEYKDSLGFSTIGVGRLIDARKGGGITYAEAMYLLTNDIARHTNDLVKALPWFGNLDAARMGVLLNMAFNMGTEHLLGFKNMLAAVERHDYVSAATEMINSTWATQVGARATRLAEQMKTGAWQ